MRETLPKFAQRNKIVGKIILTFLINNYSSTNFKDISLFVMFSLNDMWNLWLKATIN